MLRVYLGATPKNMTEKGRKNMKYYVLRPDLTPYEGIVVDKNTKLEFENGNAKQKVENLKLTIIQKEKNPQYEIESKMIVNLKKGDVLLFEKENRGYFLPAQPIGTIETAIKDYRGLATALDGVDYEITKKDVKE